MPKEHYPVMWEGQNREKQTVYLVESNVTVKSSITGRKIKLPIAVYGGECDEIVVPEE